MIGIASMRPSAAALKKDVDRVERHKVRPECKESSLCKKAVLLSVVWRYAGVLCAYTAVPL